MKKQILAALILTSLSAGAFALPQSNPQPLLGEAKASKLDDFIRLDPLAENGSERLRIAADGADRTKPNRVAEGGSDRLQERLRIAEDGADRAKQNRVAEGGSDRLQERLRVAEDGADRTKQNRVAEGGAERLQERLRVAEDGSDRTGNQRIG